MHTTQHAVDLQHLQLAYGVGPARLVLLVGAVAGGAVALRVLAHPAVYPLGDPDEGRQGESKGQSQVFHRAMS